MTITATMAGAIAMMGNMMLFMGGREGRGGAFGGILAMIFAPLAAMMVQMAISRAREYEADATGAAICGQPRALASAPKLVGAKTGALVKPLQLPISHPGGPMGQGLRLWHMCRAPR